MATLGIADGARLMLLKNAQGHKPAPASAASTLAANNPANNPAAVGDALASASPTAAGLLAGLLAASVDAALAGAGLWPCAFLSSIRRAPSAMPSVATVLVRARA